MLQFILFLLLFFYVSSRVSIHLMLQFIEADLSPSSSALEFQYISCCSLSISPRCQDNTRSLFQYISCCSLSEKRCRWNDYQTEVSIHLMLQFIKGTVKFLGDCRMFQYISCCSLSSGDTELPFYFSGFNTSHVVVYLTFIALRKGISFRFNTSHVVVYLTELINISMFHSRFNTSHVVVYLPALFLEVWFQYISCCSLSLATLFSAAQTSCFNTSHVVVYHNRIPRNFHGLIGFNTSHVVVYLTFCISLAGTSTRFNTSHVVVYLALHLYFQYISCCSLSKGRVIELLEYYKFQYISCCSLSTEHGHTVRNVTKFQYISCCSLSLMRTAEKPRRRSFNTSHVVVYRVQAACGNPKRGFNTSHVVVYLQLKKSIRCVN